MFDYDINCSFADLFCTIFFLQKPTSNVCLSKSTNVIKNKQACAAEMAVRYAALSACRKVHVCHCNSLGGAT